MFYLSVIYLNFDGLDGTDEDGISSSAVNFLKESRVAGNSSST